MRLIIKICVLSCLVSIVSAQESSLQFNTNMGLFNSSINEPLLAQSYGFLDDIEKANIIDALQSENYIQFELDNQLKYQHKNGWSLALSNHAGLYAKYSKSLIELSLLGNTPFKGDSLQLAPLGLTAFHYSQIKASFQWDPHFSTSLSFIGGHQLATLQVENAMFYTEKSGANIAYGLEFEAHYSDTTDLLDNPFEWNGMGAALGFTFNDSIANGIYEISIQDIGFIKWNESTSNRYVDSQWSFDGVNVDDFIEFNDSIINNDVDSIKDLLNRETQDHYTWRLPTTINISTLQNINSNFVNAIQLSLTHKLTIYDLARVTLEVIKNLKKHEFRLGYHGGGFERQGFQFGYAYKGKKTSIQLFTKQANSIIPSQNYGLHIGIGLKRVFSNSK